MNGFMEFLDVIPGESVRGLGEAGLMWGMAAAAAALPLAAVVLLVNLLFRRWLSAGQMGLLWCLVLARLLLPGAPESFFSLHNLWREPAAAMPADMLMPFAVDAPVGGFNLRLGGPMPYEAISSPLPEPPVELADVITALVELLWLFAAVGVPAWTAFAQLRFERRVRGTAVCREERLVGLWSSCCATAGIRSCPPIVVLDGLEQPAVTGLLHPELLLPPESLELSDDALRMVMLHELAHVRRWDIAVNWALVAVRAVQWWNPLYWLAAARFRSLQEQACDAFVMRKVSGEENREYSRLLLELAQRPLTGGEWRVMIPASLLGIFRSFAQKRELRQRLKALGARGVRSSRWQKLGATAFIVVLALCGLTDARTPFVPVGGWESYAGTGTKLDIFAPATDGTYERLVLADGAPSMRPIVEGPVSEPLETREYDVGGVIARMPLTGEKLSDEMFRRLFEDLLSNRVEQSRKAFRGNVEPENADGAQGSGIRQEWSGGRLTVYGPASLQKEAAAMLGAWEKGGPGQITVACEMITSVVDLPTLTGVEWQSFGAEPAIEETPLPAIPPDGAASLQITARVEDFVPAFVAELNERQRAAMVRTAPSDARSNLMFAPKVTLWNGQQALIADTASRPFVVGNVTKPDGHSEPRLRIVEQGTRIAMRAVLNEKTKHIELTGAIELACIEDVAKVDSVSDKGVNHSIQVPRVRRVRMSVAAAVEDGHTLLVGSKSTFGRKHSFYVLLTPRWIASY